MSTPDEDAITRIAKRLECEPFLDTVLDKMVDKIYVLEHKVEVLCEQADSDWRNRR
jgi:hypothetical protein